MIIIIVTDEHERTKKLGKKQEMKEKKQAEKKAAKEEKENKKKLKKEQKDEKKKGKKQESDGSKSKTRSKASKSDAGSSTGKDKKGEGWSKEPKPDPIKPKIDNPEMPMDRIGIERILKLYSNYDDPSFYNATVCGSLSQELVELMVRRSLILDSVLSHKCTLVAKHDGRIVGQLLTYFHVS